MAEINATFTVPELESPTPQQYREWRGQLMAQVQVINGFPAVLNAAQVPPAPGAPLPAALAFPAGAAGARMTQLVPKLYAKAYAALRGDALSVVTQAMVADFWSLLRALDGEYNQQQTTDQSILIKEFYQERLREAGAGGLSLQQWIRNKYSILLRMPGLIPVAGRNAAMKFVPVSYTHLTLPTTPYV